ncbi:hypothetical protein DFH09DRAFT_1192169 [Mycena vulgaris]|nr:hypothetical protein DFH09DRAFT_1192169 [Mycena vulgaris]
MSPAKDVQALLMKHRASRRRPGDVPYPLDYSADMINFDNWDQMFLRSCFGGLTMHQFDIPPRANAQIIGFDLKEIQPELLQFDAYYMRSLEDGGESPQTLPIAEALASRLKWVHGNLLDGLPFPTAQFDFVHISGIGLGVPEDEEVSRVMQSNGVLEIVEENLIFPCMPPRPSRRHLTPLNLDFTPRDRKDSAPPSAFSSRSSTTMISDLWSVTDSPEEHRVQKRPSLPTLPETSTDSLPRTSMPVDLGSSELSLSTQNTAFFPQEPEIVTPDHHPQDHTRLKAAWDAMLSRRFLASSVITTHPSLQISLPPSSSSPDSGSRSSGDSLESDTLFDPSIRRLSDADTFSIKSKSTACKEALWAEYEILYPGDLPPILTKTARPRDARFRSTKHSPREAFETDWSSWEHDMADRISMRGRITSEFGLTEPETPLDEPRPSTNLCRSLRAFVGWKPATPLN